MRDTNGEGMKMRIIIASKGKTLQDDISEVFARAPYFLVVEKENKEVKLVEELVNHAASQSSSAGITAARIVAEKGAEVVVSGNFGPRASSVLEQFQIKTKKASGKIEEALNKL